MNRRDFIRAFTAFSAAASAWPTLAAPSAGEAFDAAIADRPWLKPFKGVTDATQDLRCDVLALTGKWPAELRGRFYRNGPALFERGGQRHEHWFDGDGMVQQFSFTGQAVSHRGRLVRTPKLLAEQQAGRFLYSAFGTRIQGDAPPIQGPDTFNSANTNAIEHAGRLLALWEGGSAFELDPKDLSTIGPVTWRDDFQHAPFSAHPKLDQSGHLWNFGTFGARIIVWHIDPQGRLADVQVGESPYPGGMVHDMALTAQHIVLPLPPLKLDFNRLAGGATREQAFEFQSHEPLRILVMRKDDIQQRRIFELPAQMMFHVGNAYERADGNIALTFVGAKDHRSLVHNAVAVLSGQNTQSGLSSTQSVMLDMRRGRATVEGLGDAVEFPRVDPRRIGIPARYLLSASQWLPRAARQGTLYHGIQLRDLQSGKLERYDYGEHMVAEEHLVVPKPGRSDERDAWLLGTTFDTRRQVTLVNVLDARRIADGPIAQAALPYWLPLGFHGNFSAA